MSHMGIYNEAVNKRNLLFGGIFMNSFEKVIGYETIKNELMQIVDMVHNKERYEALGARMPSGVLLHGNPGIGKTLLAKCFIEECGLKSYTLRSNKGGDKFVDEITATFEKAKQNAPAIIFLDDMDKFSNEDEYVAVQAGIDDVKGHNVFVIATTNDMRKLPDSLIRQGRFDKIIYMNRPSNEDAAKIIKHYLKNKKLSDDIDFNDICKMMSYSSCASLETLINEAAIRAGYKKKDYIDMNDLVETVLRNQYESPDDLMQMDEEEIKRVAIHEAGHLVLSEVIMPGSIGLASVRTTGRNSTGGFIHKCEELERRPYEIMCYLAGKVATEMYYSDSCASGCWSDMKNVIDLVRDGISESGTNGIGMIDVAYRRFPETSESLTARNEAVTQAEIERYILQTRAVLIKNKEFLEKTADALVEKETLLYSDIQSIKNSVTITKCVA